MKQIGLFPDPPRGGPIGEATLPATVRTLAARLPAMLRFGTSSWSFPGWAGLVYARTASPSALARHGLAAYVRHPLLRCVGLDRTFYAPLDAAAAARLRAQAPPEFRFVAKALEHATIARFPAHERYGAQRGQPNPHFLDAGFAADVVVGPLVEGLGPLLGALVFQLPPQPASEVGGATRFAERLHAFLGALPPGPRYAVELRTPELLTDAYADALADVGALHCLNAHPSMPSLAAQAARTRALAGPTLLVRWMLHRGLRYEEGVARYRPFDRLVDPDPGTREAIARLCAAAHARGREAFVTINNKAEGSAPASVVALAERVVEELGA